jgi:hypothetical protein
MFIVASLSGSLAMTMGISDTEVFGFSLPRIGAEREPFW